MKSTFYEARRSVKKRITTNVANTSVEQEDGKRTELLSEMIFSN